MKLEWKLSLRIMSIGFAPFAMQAAIGMVNVVLNRTLDRYGGDLAVTSMGIVYSILIIIIMPLQGLNQGVQPIIGYNYGAKHYDRVIKAYKLAVLWATIFVGAGFILIQGVPRFFIAIFRNEEGELMHMGIRSLRACTLFLPLIGFQIITANFFQALGKPIPGTILSLSRQILLFIPLVLVLPRIFGLYGIFFAMPAADLGASILAGLMIKQELQDLKRLRGKALAD